MARSSSRPTSSRAVAPDRLAELERAADALALPEGNEAGDARGRRDEDAVTGDLLDPPRRSAEQERLAGAGLVDHLLVELADAPAAFDEVDAEEPAVRDGAGVRDCEPSRALAAADEAAHAVPDDARAELGELLRRVAARQHVEDVLELLAREVAERVGAPHELVQLVNRDLLVGGNGDDLLRQDVERVAGDARLLDGAFAHALGDDGRLEQVGAELGEDAALRRFVEAVAGAADPLQAARDRLRRLDLDDEVDGAHVDPELEGRRGDEGGDLATLEELLDLDALFTRQRAVVGAGDLALRELVQPQGKPLGQPAVVDEDDRRAVALDELQELGVDRRPDRVALPRLAHVLDRDDDAQVELLRPPGVDELDLARRRRRSGRSRRAAAGSPRGRCAEPARR